MPLVPTPIPPLPPPVRTDARLEIEPDEQWKADLRKRIEHSLRGMVEDAQVLYDNIINSQPSESSRESAMVQYDKSMSEIRTLAQEAFTRQLRSEMAERKWALDVVDSNSPDVARQQQWILDNIHTAEEQRLPFVPEDGTHHPASGLSSSPQQQGDGQRARAVRLMGWRKARKRRRRRKRRKRRAMRMTTMRMTRFTK
ncbi:hypothetical protein EDB84DRAFT_129424 [Lactarius hengduanensis]|nr:hypothetical protein EDB84DRAFT_129424 [Lactarius hengduanensis]